MRLGGARCFDLRLRFGVGEGDGIRYLLSKSGVVYMMGAGAPISS